MYVDLTTDPARLSVEMYISSVVFRFDEVPRNCSVRGKLRSSHGAAAEHLAPMEHDWPIKHVKFRCVMVVIG